MGAVDSNVAAATSAPLRSALKLKVLLIIFLIGFDNSRIK